MATKPKWTQGTLCVSPLNAQGFYTNDGAAALMIVMPDGERKRIGTIDCQTSFKRGQGHMAKCEERDANLARIIECWNALTQAQP